MKKTILLITLLLVSLSSQATLLSVELNQDSYQIGDVLTADFIISGIEEDSVGFQKLLASFDFTVSWDNSLIDYVSTTFGNKLNVDVGSDQYTDVIADSLALSEISYAWWEELLAVQDGLNSFVLASVDFTVIGNGSSTLNLSNLDFGDDFGDAFTHVSSSDIAYSVTSGNPVDVPEPTSIILVLMGLALLVRQQKMN
ncbi:hypothetical protein CXF85_08950 [Colwellia sp. 75C3]|uniref:PEP-CTERM sorting domain-containing protein n=1 Tax=Colwellia sp. 75C3 TaxID=888425 RepID=UPI000C347B37|nr:PEP-CTERM sorting domain-containing protein [Colwellia sp. 75C3]PKG84222.1 hypothetical protein CXF85_08950 [Colwellia sp. 75C3]